MLLPHQLRILLNVAFKVGAVLDYALNIFSHDPVPHPRGMCGTAWFYFCDTPAVAGRWGGGRHLTHLKKIVRIKVVVFAVGIRKGNFTICVVSAVWASSSELLLKNLSHSYSLGVGIGHDNRCVALS